MYFERFSELHSRLKQRSDVNIHSCRLTPPLSKNELDLLEKNYSLPEDLLHFYLTNVFQLCYTFRKNKDFDKKTFGSNDSAFPLMWPNESYWSLDGCINILPIDFILKYQWKDYIWFDSSCSDYTITFNGKEQPGLAFEKKLLPFDVFRKDAIAVLHFENDKAKILLSNDHNASYTDYKPMSFEAYIDKLVATNGLVKREKYFKTSY